MPAPKATWEATLQGSRAWDTWMRVHSHHACLDRLVAPDHSLRRGGKRPEPRPSFPSTTRQAWVRQLGSSPTLTEAWNLKPRQSHADSLPRRQVGQRLGKKVLGVLPDASVRLSEEAAAVSNRSVSLQAQALARMGTRWAPPLPSTASESAHSAIPREASAAGMETGSGMHTAGHCP
ncbi:uncharacterized protein LOC128932395 [Callithrix jacchus]